MLSNLVSSQPVLPQLLLTNLDSLQKLGITQFYRINKDQEQYENVDLGEGEYLAVRSFSPVGISKWRYVSNDCGD